MGHGGMMLLFTLLMVSRGLPHTVGPGVSTELARERARQMSDLRYALQFTLTPHADSVPDLKGIRRRIETPRSSEVRPRRFDENLLRARTRKQRRHMPRYRATAQLLLQS